MDALEELDSDNEVKPGDTINMFDEIRKENISEKTNKIHTSC